MIIKSELYNYSQNKLKITLCHTKDITEEKKCNGNAQLGVHLDYVLDFTNIWRF